MCVGGIEEEKGGGGRGRSGYSPKNKNPTRQCGEQDQRRERARRKKSKARKKVDRSRNMVAFHSFAAPEGRRVGSLKWQVQTAEPSGGMRNQNLNAGWGETHFKVTPHVWSTFGR